MDDQTIDTSVEGEEAEKKSCGCEGECTCAESTEAEGVKEEVSADAEATEEKPAEETATE